MLFWTPHFFDLDSTFWLDSTLKIDPGTTRNNNNNNNNKL